MLLHVVKKLEFFGVLVIGSDLEERQEETKLGDVSPEWLSRDRGLSIHVVVGCSHDKNWTYRGVKKLTRVGCGR